MSVVGAVLFVHHSCYSQTYTHQISLLGVEWDLGPTSFSALVHVTPVAVLQPDR